MELEGSVGCDVHIPVCGRGRCKDGILKLQSKLKENGLSCVSDYKELGGKYLHHFDKAFSKCSFTVFHLCHELWKKVNESQMLESDVSKVIVVSFSPHRKSRWKREEQDSSGFHGFFKQYEIRPLLDELSFNTIAKQLQKNLQKDNFNGSLKPADASEQSTEQEDSQTAQGTESGSAIGREQFEHYPHVCGQNNSQIFVRKEYLMSKPDSDIITSIKFGTPSECVGSAFYLRKTKILKDGPQGEPSPLFNYIFLKELPRLFTTKNLLGILCLTTCDHEILRHKAATLYHRLSLQERHADSTKYRGLSELVVMESLAYMALQDVSKNKADKAERNAVASDEMLGSLYMMIVGDMVMKCKDDKELKLCETHFKTVAGRSDDGTHFHKERMQDVNQFIQDLRASNSCVQLKREVDEVLKSNSLLSAEDGFYKKNTAVQFIAIFEILKKMLKKNNDESLTFLTNYMKKRGRIDCITASLLHGLMLYMSGTMGPDKAFRIGEEIQELYSVNHNLCHKNSPLMRVVALFLKKDTDNNEILDMWTEVARSLFPYLSIDRFEKALLLKKDTDNNEILDMWTDEVARSLFPYLSVDRSEKIPDEYPPSLWSCRHGTFAGKGVVICLYCPSEEAKKESKKSSFEDVYYNELKILLGLDSENVVKLVAYQDDHLPQVYILEDYVKENLQSVLDDRKRRRHWFSLSDLLKFLSDIADALAYCHDKGYVHRNLSAASAFLVDASHSARLCRFHLSIKLEGKTEVSGEHSNHVPTRWTAPESLQRNQYTKASDIWMYGHLIYEVLTHGLLPYYLISSDPEVVNKVTRKEISLPHQTSCMMRKHFELMTDCTEFSPEHRPVIDDVRMKMKEFYEECSKMPDLKIKYPDPGEGSSSVNYKKGIPGEFHTPELIENQASVEELPCRSESDTMIRMTAADKYFFREKISHKLSPQMKTFVEQDHLKNIGLLSECKILKIGEEDQHIECGVPSSCQGSLLDLTLRKAMGEKLDPYLECVYILATKLEKLHEQGWVLGDMSASNLYVERTHEELKVYVVSIAHLNPITEDLIHMDKSHVAEDSYVCARAAPEIVDGGLFSAPSDVYCFGNLLWEVLKAFDHPKDSPETFFAWKQSGNNTPDQEYKMKTCHKWEELHDKPKCCTDDLYMHIKKCVDPNSCRRNKLTEIMDDLRQLSVSKSKGLVQ